MGKERPGRISSALIKVQLISPPAFQDRQSKESRIGLLKDRRPLLSSVD